MKLLDVKDIADILGRSERTAQRMIRKGLLGAYSELGGALRVRLEEFERAVKRQEVRP